MDTPSRWPSLSVTLIGIGNITVWVAYSFRGLHWLWSLTLLIVLAFAAGWYSRAKLWGIVLIMLAPTMFVGGEYHGHPWQWLVYGQYAFFAQNMAPFIVGYCVVVGIGKLARNRFAPLRPA
jgi:hypothetical protein